MPVLWTLASGDPAQEIEEAENKLAARLHDTFKVKIGAQSPEADLARLRRLAGVLGGRASLIVDANQAWDEATALRCLSVLAELGIGLVEQPLPAWNLAGMARLRARSTVPLMADESVFSTHDMLDVARAGAAEVVSLKLVKHGGLLATRDVAAIAEAAGIGLYGGCLLESSIGAAAHLQVFAGLRELAWGCEHFGPQILVDDLVEEPLRFADFQIHLPAGSGLGVTLDQEKLRRYARA
jgi:muconate cycloisomerase